MRMVFAVFCMPVRLGRMVSGVVPLRPMPFVPSFMPLVARGMVAAPFRKTLTAGVASEGHSKQQSCNGELEERNVPSTQHTDDR